MKHTKSLNLFDENRKCARIHLLDTNCSRSIQYLLTHHSDQHFELKTHPAQQQKLTLQMKKKKYQEIFVLKSDSSYSTSCREINNKQQNIFRFLSIDRGAN